MAKRVTDEDILKINNIYYACHTYAETARQTGFSPTTVKKYVISDYVPLTTKEIAHEEIIIPSLDSYIDSLRTMKDLSNISDKEKNELPNLWREMLI